MSLRIWFCVFLVGLLLTGCESEEPLAQEIPGEAAQVVRQAPEEVVKGFMEAWSAQDYATMYSYVSAESRGVYNETTFNARYAVVQQTLGLTSVSYELDDVKYQGATAIVTYSATLESPLLGKLEDPDRIMRLTQVNNGWQIAWTPMDILNGLATDVSIQVLSRFPARGNIYDRDGNYVVQDNGTIVSVSAVQQDMTNIDECIDLLSHVLKWERSDMAALFTNYNPESLFHVGEIDMSTYAQYRGDLEATCGIFEGSDLPKIETYTNRSYVGHGSAVHITGYVGRIPGEEVATWESKGYRESDIIGVTGIERTYEEKLAGKPERYVRLVEAGGAVIRELGTTESENGVPIQLTIDMDIQNSVAQALIDAHNYAGNNWATRAKGAAVVVMKVDTGEVLALASYPFFDPSVFNPESYYTNSAAIISGLVSDARQPLRNHAVEDQYTPGSVYKIFTEVAAANQNMFPPDELFDCTLTWSGTEKYGDQVAMRQDWRVVDELEAAGPITMSQALTTSCNPFFWEMGGMMYLKDTSMHLNYVRQFGFGAPTGISGLNVGEARGSLGQLRNATDAINNAIGQGDVQVTAIQLATAVTAIANRGTLYKPYIVKQIGGFDDARIEQTYEPVVVRKLDNIKPSVYDVVHEGMCAVPTDKRLGTGWYVFAGSDDFAPSYTSCGKTGTAETGDVNSGSPPNAWYVTFAPAEKPEIVVVVVVPTSREGSDVAAPIARRILDDYFQVKEARFPGWWFDLPYIPVKPPVGVAVEEES